MVVRETRHREIIERTAIARKDRKNLLVIGSLKLLGTFVPLKMVPSENGTLNIALGRTWIKLAGVAGPPHPS
jgi:hypothetical protein